MREYIAPFVVAVDAFVMFCFAAYGYRITAAILCAVIVFWSAAELTSRR